MGNEVRKFMKSLLILASIVGVVVIGVIYMLPPEHVSLALPYILIFHTLATFVSFAIINKKISQEPMKFVNVYLGVTTVKLMLYIAILLIYSFNFLHDAVNFIISFFVMYVIFTIFEVIQLVKASKKARG